MEDAIMKEKAANRILILLFLKISGGRDIPLFL
jgi:hypothetical protein